MFVPWLLTFVGCLFLSLISTWCVCRLANLRGWLAAPRADRHIHTVPVPRIGGVAICISFTAVASLDCLVLRYCRLAFLLPERAVLGLLGPALIVFLLGLYDDVRSVEPHWKFAVQAVAAVCLYLAGFGVHIVRLPFAGYETGSTIGLPLTVFWVLLITNAFNLIDGLDGLAAGSALFSTIVVLIVSIAMPNSMVTFLAVALGGSILGFLRFNFHPASIFLGDSGSLFIGFMLSALALVSSQKAPTIVAVGIPVISLGLPILDVTLAVTRRFISGQSLFKGDAGHIHHKLLKRGFSQRHAVLILYASTACFGFLSLVLLQDRRMIALILAISGTGIFLGVQQLRYHEFAEILSTLRRAGRHRKILANHVAIRRAAETLKSCNEVRSILRTLRDTFQPLGFDGVVIHCADRGNPSTRGRASSDFELKGVLQDIWATPEANASSWELRMDLITTSNSKCGHLSLIRRCERDDLAMDVNILLGDFRASISDALSRASCGGEIHSGHEENRPAARSLKQAAASMAD